MCMIIDLTMKYVLMPLKFKTKSKLLNTTSESKFSLYLIMRSGNHDTVYQDITPVHIEGNNLNLPTISHTKLHNYNINKFSKTE